VRVLTSSSSSRPRIPHLAGLDGLRGLGLLGVLLFHADGLLPGGYLGVDLFFVLSGYLITSLLLAEQRQSGRIDLYAFWVRRCRRLFPALLALMPAIAAYARFVARPEDLQTLRRQAIASLGYFANWQSIFGNRSYWDLFAAPSPLEHTWSLSIEEQFYVLWPILLVLVVRRFGTRGVLALSVLLSLVSMAAMLLVFSPADSSRAYLGTDTRMGGILAGAALATVLPSSRQLSREAARVLDGLGLLALLGLGYAWVRLRGTSPFLYRGGFWLAELGVLVLIACAVADRHSYVARALSFKPLTWLGTISYGAYLWHWPIHVLITSERTHLYGPSLQGLRFVLTFVVAILSYRLIEQPVRQRGVPFGRPHIIVPAALASALFLVVHATYARSDERTQHANNVGKPEDVQYRILVFGDSTANALGWGFRQLHQPGMGVELLGKDGCTMLWDRCNGGQWVEKVRTLRADATVISLAGAFLAGFGEPDGWHTACRSDWDAMFEKHLSKRLQELDAAKANVFIVTAPYPLEHWDQPEFRTQVDCINASVRKAAATAPSVHVLDLHERICPKGVCQRALPDHSPLRPDGVHFSMAGAEVAARWLFAQIQATGPATAEAALAH
jgi:peptidoglycan/LPS O-acetylase OafA/YrhL/lysophospholipase L1-like esterase